MSPLTYLWPMRPLVILEKRVLSTGEKKYYILITKPQHALGHCAEDFEMRALTSPVTSSACWRCGTPHKGPPSPAYLEQLRCNPAVLLAGGTRFVPWLVPRVPAGCSVCLQGSGGGSDGSLSWLLPVQCKDVSQKAREMLFPQNHQEQGKAEKLIPRRRPGPAWLICTELIHSGPQRTVR